ELYLRIKAKYSGVDSKFTKIYMKEDTDKFLYTFVSRVLKSFNFTTRSPTLGRKIPEDWRNQCEAFFIKSQSVLNSLKPTVVLAADETFVNFKFPSDNFIVPVGQTQVIGDNSKECKGGASLMVTASLFENKLLKPFVILDAE